MRSICFCSKSSELITLTLAGDRSSGMSKRVAVTTIGSASISLGEGVGDASWPKQMSGAKMRSAVSRLARHTSLAGRASSKKVGGGSCDAAREVRERETRLPASESNTVPGTNQIGQFSITSFLQLRELDLLGSHRFRGHRPPPQQAGSSSSHSSFCEEVFSRVAFVAALAAASAGRLTQPPLQHE